MNPQYTAISPLDGRYATKTIELQQYFSEQALFQYRADVEIAWYNLLISQGLSNKSQNKLDNITIDIEAIKHHEKTTNHDLKALEYYLKDSLSNIDSELIHFGATSEDINNVAYSLILKDFLNNSFIKNLNNLVNILKKQANKYANTPMLARTHGQAATPTTVGKEFSNFAYRLEREITKLTKIEILAKFNGATGNFNALKIACPDKNWPEIVESFIESLGLTYNPYVTQIEPHDYIAEISHNIVRINNILLDLSRDAWHYISLDYFGQKAKEHEVGSSTMPHKINPIDFENAEGNLGLANSLFNFFANKLQVSRLQRDLSDSTVLRNLGSAFGYCVIAYNSLEKGLGKIIVNQDKLLADLNNNWEVLGEALQTVMRINNIEKPYEKLKELTRGKKLDQNKLHEFIDSLDLDLKTKENLKLLTPDNYLGFAEDLAKNI